jgi:uncharacterized protein YndB with AHSA1/START domain
MTQLAFSLDRTVDIRARRATVFRFFTDPERFARWWGAGSSIDPVVGGTVTICYPGGTTASGHVTELVPDRRIAFTYGYDRPGASIPPGGSLVTIELVEIPDGTRVVLRHDVTDARTRDEHVQGWRYALALFASVAAADALSHAGVAIATWFDAWNEPDATRCRELLTPIVAADISFRDANGCVVGLDELLVHVAAVQRFMPGIRLEPRGKVRSAHGTTLIDWAAMKADAVAMTGTNVVRFAPDGMIAEVIGVPS